MSPKCHSGYQALSNDVVGFESRDASCLAWNALLNSTLGINQEQHTASPITHCGLIANWEKQSTTHLQH